MGEGTIYPLMRRMQAVTDWSSTYLMESASGPPRQNIIVSPRKESAPSCAQRAEWDAFEIAVKKILGGGKGRAPCSCLR